MIHKKTAQQIVDTVKDVCGFDINFIDSRGLVLASTDPARIGTVHEGGRQVIARGGTLEVPKDGLFPGTKKGVNIPVFLDGILTAVIGISGEPEQVRAYAHLAERITLLLLREQELGAAARTLARRRNYLLDLLLDGEPLTADASAEIREELKSLHVDASTSKRILLLKLWRQGSQSLSELEGLLSHLLESLPGCLYGYQYPATFRILINADDLELYREKLGQFESAHPGSFGTAAGSAASLEDLPASLSTARIALETLERRADRDSFCLFDDLTLEILLAAVPARTQSAFCQRILSPLDADDLALLRVYFEKDQSLSNTCQALFLHKNTVQYKLNRIYRLCGLNPRRFQDAVVLCLALKLQDCYM